MKLTTSTTTCSIPSPLASSFLSLPSTCCSPFVIIVGSRSALVRNVVAGGRPGPLGAACRRRVPVGVGDERRGLLPPDAQLVSPLQAHTSGGLGLFQLVCRLSGGGESVSGRVQIRRTFSLCSGQSLKTSNHPNP